MMEKENGKNNKEEKPIDIFIKCVNGLYGIEINEDFSFEAQENPKLYFKLDVESIDKKIESLDTEYKIKNNALYNNDNKKYEILAYSYIPLWWFTDEKKLKWEQKKIFTCQYSLISDEYFLYILNKMKKEEFPTPLQKAGYEISGPSSSSEREKVGLDFFKGYMNELYTIKITMENGITNESEFFKRLESYLYQLGSRKSTPITVLRKQTLEEFLIRKNPHFVEKPHFDDYNEELTFIPELVARYNKAIEFGHDCLPQYIFFYQIIEYFFIKVLMKIINEIDLEQGEDKTGKLEGRLKDTVKKDSHALKETLKYYVTEKGIENIKNKLEEYDKDDKDIKSKSKKNIIKRFKENPKMYTGKEKKYGVHFRNKNDKDKDYDNLFGQLAKRIYFIRNYLVHSKKGKGIRYKPHQDDEKLQDDVALIRFISEEIIENSAKQD